jgi:O-antigen/teichoic acid export membrane protein
MIKDVLHKHVTSKYPKMVEWGKLISITGSAQVMIQAIGFVSGIMIIRLLSTPEYALYTLANTMLGTMTLLSDGGINTGVMALGGKVWQDKVKLGIVMNTGMDLRKKFAVVSLIIAIPILIVFLRHNEASWLMSILIIASLIPAFFTALSGSLLEIAPKLHQDIGPLQKNQILSNVFRAMLLGATIFIFPWAFIAILSGGLPQLWANIRLRKISSNYVDLDQKPDPVVRKEILTVVKKILPGAIYYCIYGQITIWLISIFGSTTAIAQIGALSRLTMILNLFTVLFTVLIIPRFARLPEYSTDLLSRFYKIQAGLLVLSIGIVFFVILFPTQILLLLGNKYSGLNTEIILITISSCLSMIAGVTNSILFARGWVMYPVVSIGVSMLAQIVLLFVLDLTNMQNVLLFSIINFVVAYVMLVLYFIIKNHKHVKSIKVAL